MRLHTRAGRITQARDPPYTRAMLLPPLPPPVRDLITRLEQAGCETALVGRCVRELLTDRLPADFEALVRAGAHDLLALLPRAVVTAPEAARLTVPTAAGPLDLVPLDPGAALEDALLRRDFTIHAIAWRAAGEPLCDPHRGLHDLAAGRLRAVGSAAQRLAEDPLRALRAARLVAELGLDIDPELESALAASAAAIPRLPASRVRQELELLLLAPDADRGLTLLRRTGLERAFAPGIGDDAAQVVVRLPPRLELRLAGWLRGARAHAILRDLRCPRDRAARVERLLALHPIDAGSAATRESRARRLARRPEPELRDLLALREAEVAARGDAEGERRLARLRRALARAQRAERAASQRASLALDGRAVMEQLGCGPGAKVGRALAFLAERISADPRCNTPATLRALLDAWAKQDAEGGAGAGDLT
jgi:tRNA nucleotidyltransferase/poly(A) polymerase